MYTSIIAVFAFAMAASAKLTVRDAQVQACGKSGQLSCCNPSTTDVASSGLISALTPILAAGSCAPVPLTGVLGGAQDICGGNAAYCCSGTSTSQTGLINLSTTCSPIDLGLLG